MPKIIQDDAWLVKFKDVIIERFENAKKKQKQLAPNKALKDFATGHLYFGLHKTDTQWEFREWAPNASEIFLVGEFSEWKPLPEFLLKKLKNGVWEIVIDINRIQHLQQYKLLVKWNGGEAYRLPSYGNFMVQDLVTNNFNAQIWQPNQTYKFINAIPGKLTEPILVYEAHVGMGTDEEKVGSFNEFRINILPRIKKAGYNTIQLMAIQEHPYYGSFGYHVSNLFAVSSRFGNPCELKWLIDEAHGMGIRVIMDLVHSHAVKNEAEGLGLFDGSEYQYFHTGARRMHVAWDSLCFNYSKPEVLHFLLSNCHYWLAEYKFDGFRFDGVTSMLYYDHGLNRNFVNYEMYYDGNQDEDAISYLYLSNKLIHEVNPHAITIAEEMSGMPGLGAPLENGGFGFDYRLAMGIPDYWIKLTKDVPDEDWDINKLFYELKSHRAEEKTISYAESHDQALVGDKTLFFRLTDKDMYFSMDKNTPSIVVDRGIALHKIIRLITLTTAGAGYLNFMGNEFGHPEWIDFPREGNNWSYKFARRQWGLSTNNNLKYHWLLDFDEAMIDFVKNANIFESAFPIQQFVDEKNKILGYSRGNLLFVFNFNPSQSFPDYDIAAEPGKYKVVFNTDDEEFGGQNRIDKNITYFTTSKGVITTLKTNYISIYLPARTGLVLNNIPVRTVYD